MQIPSNAYMCTGPKQEQYRRFSSNFLGLQLQVLMHTSGPQVDQLIPGRYRDIIYA